MDARTDTQAMKNKYQNPSDADVDDGGANEMTRSWGRILFPTSSSLGSMPQLSTLEIWLAFLCVGIGEDMANGGR